MNWQEIKDDNTLLRFYQVKPLLKRIAELESLNKKLKGWHAKCMQRAVKLEDKIEKLEAELREKDGLLREIAAQTPAIKGTYLSIFVKKACQILEKYEADKKGVSK